MSYGMYVSAAGAATQARRLEVLANNLANVETPGFRQRFGIPEARHAAAIRQGLVSPLSRGPDNVGGGVALAEVRTSLAPGPIRHTGKATDFAIDGTGFFLVADGARRLLTRAGGFHLDATGRLLTPQGFSVLAEDGNPIVLDPARGWSFEERGTLVQGDARWRLALVEPDSLEQLVPVGETTFRPIGPYQAVARERRSVRQGYLEGSTVRPAETMIELIETSRAFEMNARMVQNHDAASAALIRRVLRS